MGRIVYARKRDIIPTLPVAPPERLRIIWRGTDGSVWNLTDPWSGVFITRDSVEGLHFPEFTEWTQKSGSVPGQLWQGGNEDPRSITSGLYIGGGVTRWADLDTRFWDSMAPDSYGVLEVSSDLTNEVRRINARHKPNRHPYTHDPFYFGWHLYAAEWIADDPFWSGDPDRVEFEGVQPMEFYETIGPQLVNINSAQSTSTASITNSGKVPAWPVWTLDTPDPVTVGVGTSLIRVPGSAAGRRLILNTDPRVQALTEVDVNGNVIRDRTTDILGAVNFAPIPPGEAQPIVIQLSGTNTGRVACEVTPRYWRAW